MRIAILLPSLKKKGPVILAFDLIIQLIGKVDKIDVFYFSDCIDPYILDPIHNVNFIKLSFFKPYSFIDYDILHTHSFKPDFFSFYFKNKIQCPVVTTIHNYVYEELYYTYNLLVSRLLSKVWIFSWSNKNTLVFLSNNMKKYYEKVKCLKNNNIVIYNGRDVILDSIIEQKNQAINSIIKLKDKFKIIGCCGFLNKRKGFEDVVKFLTLNSNLFAVFIGQGPDEARLTELAKSLNVFDRCIFLGHQNNSMSLIRLFDIFVMSSFSEGFPLVALEAGGLNVPILCVKSPLFEELFSESDVVFYERNNLNSMSFSINKILNFGNVYSSNLYRTINTKYTCSIMADKYLKLFKELKSS
jgi:glycosyltransferase involved in cell wall biosynthesis